MHNFILLRVIFSPNTIGVNFFRRNLKSIHIYRIQPPLQTGLFSPPPPLPLLLPSLSPPPPPLCPVDLAIHMFLIIFSPARSQYYRKDNSKHRQRKFLPLKSRPHWETVGHSHLGYCTIFQHASSFYRLVINCDRLWFWNWESCSLTGSKFI